MKKQSCYLLVGQNFLKYVEWICFGRILSNFVFVPLPHCETPFGFVCAFGSDLDSVSLSSLSAFLLGALF
jgi:hypothetical protein